MDGHNHSHCNHCNKHHKSCISLVPIFNHLEKEQMEEIMVTIKSGSYKKGEIIYSAGDRSDSLYIVNKGRIRIYRLSDSGKEQLVRILTSGGFTGELALFNETTHESYAQAMEDTEVCMINRRDLQDFLMRYPSISIKILSEFSRRLEESERQTARVSTERVETRIALFLAECMDNAKSTEFTLPMSKKDLASYLGATPETISRKLTDLEDEGYIKQKKSRRILVLDPEGLKLI
jgi:CRP-like cAMP-binding protein